MLKRLSKCGNWTEQDERNAAIERDIKRSQSEQRKIYKILLLGTGGCGKSTFLKQMKLIENESGRLEEDPFPEKVREEMWRPIIYLNIYSGIKEMIRQMDILRIAYEDDKNRERGRSILQILNINDFINPDKNGIRLDYALKVRDLWEDKGIQRCFERRAEYQLDDSAQYFLDNLEAVLADNYVPSVEHVLHARIKTTTIHTQDLPINDTTVLRMIDVGGQRGYREKWIHYFDNVVSVIFITSLAEFNLKLEEDQTMSRTKESLHLFENILKLPFFFNTCFILFLNKKDLMVEKLEAGVNFEKYFPDFDADDFEDEPDVIKEAEYMRRLYMECYNRPCDDETDRTIYSHVTCATDTASVRLIWDVVRNIILESALRLIALN